MFTSMEAAAYLLMLNCFAMGALQARSKYSGQLKPAVLERLIYFFVLLVCICRKSLGTCARQTKAVKGKPEAKLKDQHMQQP